MGLYVYMSAGVCEGYRHQIPMELEVQVVVRCTAWVLEIELESSVREVCVLNYTVKFPGPHLGF